MDVGVTLPNARGGAEEIRSLDWGLQAWVFRDMAADLIIGVEDMDRFNIEVTPLRHNEGFAHADLRLTTDWGTKVSVPVHTTQRWEEGTMALGSALENLAAPHTDDNGEDSDDDGGVKGQRSTSQGFGAKKKADEG